jgi:hypothetical protein
MRELTVRIRFTLPCLGNVKKGNSWFYLPCHPNGSITFLSTWHQCNMRTAAELISRHHKTVESILWDVFVDGKPPKGESRWHQRFYTNKQGKSRYSRHECFPTDHIVGINCAVPAQITDDDMVQLMSVAGRYCGLSPWGKPTEFGRFEVESIRPRRLDPPEREEASNEPQEKEVKEKPVKDDG